MLYRLGRRDLAGDLELLLSDDAVVTDEFAEETRDERVMVGEVRDVVLATLLLWSGRDATPYNYPQGNHFLDDLDATRLRFERMMFHDDATRAAALARWRRYQADRKVQSAANAATLRTDPQGASLLRQLGSDSWTEREQAVERLRQLGSRATRLLRAGCEDTDPEVADRCRRLLEP
jgi:hypothetical protein